MSKGKRFPNSFLEFELIKRIFGEILREINEEEVHYSNLRSLLSNLSERLTILKNSLAKDLTPLPSVMKSLNEEELFNLKCRAIEGKLYKSKVFYNFHSESILNQNPISLINDLTRDVEYEISQLKLKLPKINMEIFFKLNTQLYRLELLIDFICVFSYITREKREKYECKQKLQPQLRLVVKN